MFLSRLTIVIATAASAGLLAAPGTHAATTDTATATASPGPYLVGAPITFTSTTACTVPCRLIWRYLDGSRLGVQLGEGTSVQKAFDSEGLKTVQLELSETCVGTTRITCTSVAYVSVFVEAAVGPTDTTPPTFTASGLTADATGPSTVVDYRFAASDQDDAVVSQSCSPAPGSSFPVGSTPISCTATDSHGNVGHDTFAVVVSDNAAPTLTVPADMTREATSAAGAAVDFAVAASDAVDGALVPSCSRASGSVFPLGATKVDCSVADAHQNTTSASFLVSVSDTTPPDLTLPASLSREASSAAGATVEYAVSAHDAVDGGLAPACSTPSGAVFPLGSTRVSCSVSDSRGNTRRDSFAVVVVDTTAPRLTMPAGVVVAAASKAGAAVTFAVGAQDAVDGAVPARCSKASGSTFPIGVTRVTCTATDAHGNASPAGELTVRVQGAAEQLGDVLARVRAWGARAQALRGLLRSAAAAAGSGRSTLACRRLAVLDARRPPVLHGLSRAELTWLHGRLARVEAVLGCGRTGR
jgi:hypothetical protein